jgi:hypothetical protein
MKRGLIKIISNGQSTYTDKAGNLCDENGRAPGDPEIGLPEAELEGDDGEPEKAQEMEAPVLDEDKPITELHWTKLKKRVVESGGEWTNKEAAIEFLSREA